MLFWGCCVHSIMQPSGIENELWRRRLRAVAILRLRSVDALHKRLPICPRAIAYQIKRGALSEPVLRAIIEQIGADAWRFICGEVDTLTVEKVRHAAA
jgi:hypothetical protein